MYFRIEKSKIVDTVQKLYLRCRCTQQRKIMTVSDTIAIGSESYSITGPYHKRMLTEPIHRRKSRAIRSRTSQAIQAVSVFISVCYCIVYTSDLEAIASWLQ